MVQAVPKEGVIEQYEKPMPRMHWQRNRKQTVVFAHDTPFATERQLEDQRLLMKLNRNPQALALTKCDKLRSETLNAKKGETRAVAVKANVLNKIVREASGVYNYAIVPPPIQNDASATQKNEKVDPELHPKLKPYASEAKMKPVVCSFGHRPKSASRTFLPATMKFRLKHGEVVKSETVQTGFGLPVAVLAKVLKAAHIRPPSAQEDILVDDAISEPTIDSNHRQESLDYSDLFLSAEDEKTLFDPIRKVSKSAGSQGDDGNADGSWISSIERKKMEKSRSNSAVKLEPLNSLIDRPAWNEAHYMIQMTSKEKYSLKQSRMLQGEILPVAERLNRFNPVSAGLTDFNSGFCDSKRYFDKIFMSGVPTSVPKSTPVKGRPLYFDPYDNQLKEVKDRFKEMEVEREAKLQAKKYQEALYQIPKAEYFPTTELAKIVNSMDGSQQTDQASYAELNATTQDIDWSAFEVGYKAALKAARKGDTSALQNFYMKTAADLIAEVPIADNNGRPPSPIGSPGRISSTHSRHSSRLGSPGRN